MSLPRALQPFLDFTALLRAHQFAVSPDQTMGWIEATGLLGPRDITDLHRAALALFAIPRERHQEFDALFHSFFYDRTIKAAASTDDDFEAYEPTGGEAEVQIAPEESEPGVQATATERLAQRVVSGSDDEVLIRFARTARHVLPRRQSYRRRPAHRGDALDMRKTLRQAVRQDGEVFQLAQRRRKLQQRRILLLIDVSGSMQENSADLMRFAHVLAQISDRFECFTLGTRLTRITSALRTREQAAALQRVGELVADFDGGTRIGDALQALLAVPRYASYSRGASVIVLSDGLERDDPVAMTDAVRRLSRMAWRLVWLSPLAGSDGYRPETDALATILPWLDRLDDAGSIDAICRSVLNLARAA